MSQVKAVSDYLLALNPASANQRPVPDFSTGKPFYIEGLSLVDLTQVALAGGEALTGLNSGNEIAHVEGFAGRADGPAGIGYAVALGRQQDQLNNLEAIFFPNQAARPRTVIVTKVKTDSIFRAAQMFGPVQQAVADAVMAAHEAKYFGDVGHGADDTIRIVVTPFVHPNAGMKDENADKEGMKAKWVQLEGNDLERANYALYWNNFWATLGVLNEMVTGGASTEDVLLAWKSRGDHPFLGFEFAKSA